jgi:3',5'-cyclic AMP phosphodiesterase CpdA
MCGCSLPQQSAGVRFIVIGDWGRQGKEGQKETAEQMGKTAAGMDADFIISTGDNFYDNGVLSTNDTLWKKSFEDIYTSPALMKPWYVVLGNHDYRGDVSAQISYTQISSRWKMFNRYFVVDTSLHDVKIRLVCIDTSPLIKQYYQNQKYKASVEGQDTASQWRWLDSILLSSTADWTIVVGHHPVYSAGTKHGNTVELIERLKPLLEKNQVRAYFAGHEHDLQHLKGGEVNYFISGAGSALRPSGKNEWSLFSQSVNGFLTVSVTKTLMNAAFINLHGDTIYTTVIHR